MYKHLLIILLIICPLFYQGTSAQRSEDVRVEIYPNPTTDVLNIKIINATEKECIIEIFNALGGLVLKKKANGNQIMISTLEVSKGIYFVKIKRSEELAVVRRVAIK